MTKTSLVKRCILGAQRNWTRIPVWFFVPLGAAWAITEPISFFLPDIVASLIQPYRIYILIFIFSASLLNVIVNIYEPISTRIKVSSNGTYLNIIFGDIFLEHKKSHIAIPVNDFFDTHVGGGLGQIGDVVAPTSLHGLFIKKMYPSNTIKLDNEIDIALSNVSFDEVNRRIGKNKRYPIGTTASLGTDENKEFLFALAYTDTETNMAKADVPTMWHALQGLWRAVRIHSNGQPVAVPLVGSGLSNVGLDPESLLNIIILSIKQASELEKITGEISIILHESLMEDISIRNIK